MTTTSSSSTTQSNLCRIAEENEIQLHTQAIEVLKLIIPQKDHILYHLKSKSKSDESLSKKITKFRRFIFINDKLEQITSIKHFLRKSCYKNQIKYIKIEYNTLLNRIHNFLSNESELNNLLYINEQLTFIKRRIPVVREHVDFINASLNVKIGQEPFMLRVKGPESVGGARTEFESASHCLSVMRNCIEQCVDWNDIFIITANKVKYYHGLFSLHSIMFYFGLKIKFPGFEHWIDSNSTKIKHILCSEHSRHSRHYDEFLHLVEVQIIRIIKNSHLNPNCKFAITNCCRVNPECNGICLHSKNEIKYGRCGTCNLILCVGGCGHVYHGETPCDVILDEKTELMIQNSSKKCPNVNCGVFIHKTDGCNHITCSLCHTEFCYLCNAELPKDIHGHYDVSAHFNTGVWGVGQINGCLQFEN